MTQLIGTQTQTLLGNGRVIHSVLSHTMQGSPPAVISCDEQPDRYVSMSSLGPPQHTVLQDHSS